MRRVESERIVNDTSLCELQMLQYFMVWCNNAFIILLPFIDNDVPSLSGN